MQLRPYQQELIDNCRQAYKDGYLAPCLVLPCGGGKSIITADIAKKVTDKKGRVLFLVHRKELCEQIENTFKHYGVDMKYCKVMMVQTASRRLDKLPTPSLIITDEGHHCKANTYRKIYDYFHTVRRVFVTATPCRMGGDGLAGVADVLLEGPSVKWLIEQGNLSPYRYYAPTLADFSKIHSVAGEFNIREVDELLNKNNIYGDVIKYYRQLADGKQGICYCVNVDHSKEMAKIFRSHGIPARHIDGDTDAEIRADIIRQFRNGECKILCNVGLISEGFDVPNCDVVILLRPTKSLSLYIQQAMRCMRYKENKMAIIIDHVGNYLRHGMPDDDREWQLTGKVKSKSEYTEEGKLIVRTCKMCFSTYPNSMDKCPQCGQLYVTERKELEHMQEIQLKEIKEAEKQQAREIAKTKSNIADCNSYQECVEWCKAHGKKMGYAYHHWNSRKYSVKIGGA
jgi:superfamily II DNA or RNA helicase